MVSLLAQRHLARKALSSLRRPVRSRRRGLSTDPPKQQSHATPSPLPPLPKKRSKTFKFAVGTSAALVATGGYIWCNPQVIGYVSDTDAWVLAQAVVRGLRLAQTVACIIADYKLNHLYIWNIKPKGDKNLTKEAEIALEEAEKELRKCQNVYEDLSFKLRNTETPEERKKLEEKSKEAREALLGAAARLSKVEEHAKGVSQKGLIHQKAADRLLELCQTNGGAYIKIGQHISQLDYLLPREITETLKVLLNRAPRSTYEDVREVIKEELGRYPEDIWARFEEEAIASASLAQVHVAYDNQGRKMAVKVQHRGLRETSRGDILAVSFFINLVADLFPEFSYRWLAEEMAPQLPKELDFVNEAHNATTAAEFFKHRSDVVIPEIMWENTKPRVLTMKFEEGCCATDVKELKTQGLSLDKVASLVTSVICEQVFQGHFVHSDPHPANVLIRPHPKRKHEPVLVLLDHGLYKELSDEFRMDYCQLWRALALKDLPQIEYYCKKLNSGEMYSLLAAILTSRGWDDISNPDLGSLRMPNTLEDKTLIRSYAQKYVFEITEVLNSVPREINDCLRHIDRALGSPVNSSLITAEEAVKALYKEELKHKPGLIKRTSAWWQYMKVKLRIKLYLRYVSLSSMWRRPRAAAPSLLGAAQQL